MIACPNCKSTIPAEHVNTGQMHPCTGCRSDIRADGYNALLKKDPVDSRMDGLLENDEAECFFHPGKKAVAPCDACGRLLCSLCQVELNGQNLCLNCLKVGKDKQKISTLQDSQVLYDVIAFDLAFWPVIMLPLFFFTLVTAPVAVYFAVRHLRTPAYVFPKKRARSIIAMIFAMGQMAGWVIFALNLFLWKS